MKQIPKRIKHFKKQELKCSCCGEFNIDSNFLEKLETARMIAGIPFRITSGCRCVYHNSVVTRKLKSNSLHRTDTKPDGTKAVDIAATNDKQRGKIIRALLRSGIDQIGINTQDNFIHAEDDPGLAIWIYDV